MHTPAPPPRAAAAAPTWPSPDCLCLHHGVLRAATGHRACPHHTAPAAENYRVAPPALAAGSPRTTVPNTTKQSGSDERRRDCAIVGACSHAASTQEIHKTTLQHFFVGGANSSQDRLDWIWTLSSQFTQKSFCAALPGWGVSYRQRLLDWQQHLPFREPILRHGGVAITCEVLWALLPSPGALVSLGYLCDWSSDQSRDGSGLWALEAAHSPVRQLLRVDVLGFHCFCLFALIAAA